MNKFGNIIAYFKQFLKYCTVCRKRLEFLDKCIKFLKN